MIVDAFTYLNEDELLDIRLNELNGIVDRTVICESTFTHAGNAKVLNFNMKKYSNFENKIRYLVENGSPDLSNAWVNENRQRAFLAEGLKDLKPGDYVIVSDLDEIPSAEAVVKSLDVLTKTNMVIFKHRTYYYYVNYFALDYVGAKIMTYEKFRTTFQGCPQKVRDCWQGQDVVIIDGGWHFGYLGGKDKVLYKLDNFAHQEHKNNGEIPAILSNIGKMIDVRGRKLIKVPIDATFPEYLVANKDKFAALIGG